jgi:hypothetical protein
MGLQRLKFQEPWLPRATCLSPLRGECDALKQK